MYILLCAHVARNVGLGPIFTDLSGKGDEHEEHGGVAREIRGQNTRITSKSC